MMSGMALAIFTYRPIFNEFLETTRVSAEAIKSGEKPDNVKTIILNKDTIITITKFDFIMSGIRFDAIQSDTIYFDKVNQHFPSKPAYINKKLGNNHYWKFVGLVFILILYVTMVYGPIAAFLVELFPTKIRYTSMSLPYHIGNGVFGGLVPFIGLLLTTTYPADPRVGFLYPIGVG